MRTADWTPTPRKKRVRALILPGLSMAVLAALVALPLWLWNRPLGPRLQAVSDEPVASLSLLEPVEPPLCGGPPDLLIMAIAIDTEAETENRSFADVIRLVRVDSIHAAATMIPIPRDLWVPIPGAEDIGVSESRISAVYAYGNRYRGLGGGALLVADALAEQFAFVADRYVVFDFAAFAAGIDAIGGVDIYLPEAIDATDDGLAYIPAGWNHLDGQRALAYARARPDNTSDLARIERQTRLIQAIQQRVTSPQVLPSLPRLAQSMRDSVLTDLSPSEISMLLCIGRKMDADDIHVIDLDGSMYTSSTDQYGHQRLLPDRQAITAFLRAFRSGNLVPGG